MFVLDSKLNADTFTIGDLALCRVLLVNDANYPWLILVPRRNNIQESYQLSKPDQQQLLLESNTVGQLLMSHFEGDKLNVAAIGNLVPQLHIHHVIRFKNDLLWPKPIWGANPARAYSKQKIQSLSLELSTLISTEMELTR